MCCTSRIKDFTFVSPQKYPGDLLAGKVMRDFSLLALKNIGTLNVHELF